jgi:phosphatidylserine decarboxylase
MTIHKEGYTSIIIVLVFVSIINTLTFLYSDIKFFNYTLLFISIVFFSLIVRFFRKPVREIEKFDDKLIYAPADGTVVVIEETEEAEYFKDKRIQVSIFMSPYNVHINWIPLSGIIKYFKYHPGKNLIAHKPKSSTDNERTTVVVENKSGVIYLMRQIAGAVARRIVYYAKEGVEFKQGEELGFIKFGSRVDLFLPLDTEILVKIDDKTVGNKTLVARLK